MLDATTPEEMELRILENDILKLIYEYEKRTKLSVRLVGLDHYQMTTYKGNCMGVHLQAVKE